MGDQNITHCDTIFDNCKKIENYRIQCKECINPTFICVDRIRMEAHLFHKHNIHTTDSLFVWVDKIIKRYFINVNKYSAVCKVCHDKCDIYYKYALQNHMETHEKILNEIKEEIKGSWMSGHCSLNSSTPTKQKCNYCDFDCKIVDGTNYMERHLEMHDIIKPPQSGGETSSYNAEETIQQSAAEENPASTSFPHDNRQIFGSQGVQQRFAPGTSTSMSDDNLHRVIQRQSETETSEPMIQPQQGTAGSDIRSIEVPSSYNLPVYLPLPQHRPYDETREQTIQPQQGTAGSNIRLDYEDFTENVTLQAENEF